MPKISRADLARLAGVSKAAITQAVKRRALAAEADGSIDTDLPLNAGWLADKRAGRKGPHPESKPEAPKRAAKLPTEEEQAFQRAAWARKEKREAVRNGIDGTSPVDDDEDYDKKFDKVLDILATEKTEKIGLTKARREQAEADTRLKNVRYDRERGILVTWEDFRRDRGRLEAAIKTNFRDMPRRIAAQVHAVAVSGGPAEVEAFLERQVSAAIDAALGAEG